MVIKCIYVLRKIMIGYPSKSKAGLLLPKLCV
jgi:hypothetical protein